METRFVKSKVALCMAFLLIFTFFGCNSSSDGGSGSGGNEQTSQARLEENLTTFNTAAGGIMEDMQTLGKTVDQLNTAIDTDDASPQKTEEIGELVDQFESNVDALTANVEAMDDAEAAIQQAIGSETGVSSIALVTLAGAGAVISGLYSFASSMKEKSDKMIEQRKQRDKDADDVYAGKEGALEKFRDSREKMAETGQEVTKELATKIISDGLTSPFNPTSTTGVVIKHVAGNKIQDGLKVISATEECKDDYDDPGCKIGVDEVDDLDSAATPPGKTTVVVTGDDIARTVAETEITENTYEEITFDPLPIVDAADEMLPKSDDNADDNAGDTDEEGDSGDDSDGSDGDSDASMQLSKTLSSEDADSITYSVAAAVAGVDGSTSVTISVENASTSGSTKTISEDSTVFWSVTVFEKDAVVSVRRSDTAEIQTLTLPGKGINYDGTYKGMAVTTYEAEDYFCWDSVTLTVFVTGSTLGGDVTGSISGNTISGRDNEYPELLFDGTISGDVMSGTWYDSADGNCSGTFSLTRQ